ncbi:NAD(P)-dependent oxidoreductase [Caldivirga sp.]|uniref:NAD(P)-dependent oxidoreductase n=1 Tax=Caldivirga sp. TaxID=2080243 RepID=UPI0025BAAEDB|nr:NAD(P)-dependent oxidoreductase [Caldivirga sp.]
MVRVGLIGLGTMGWRIAKNLRDDGLLVGVFNRTMSKALRFAEEFKVHVFNNPAELASNVDVVVSIVSDDDAVKSIMLGEGGVINGIKQGSLIIEMSTISPSTSIELASKVKEKGGLMVDAPIIGTSVLIEKREAVVLIGGEKEAYERAYEVVRHFARYIIHIGPNGYGLYAKLINNALLGSYVAALAEVVNLGEAMGLSSGVIMDVLTKLSSARSPTSELKVPKMINNDFSPQFATKHMRKDLDLVNKEASRLGVPIPMAALSLQLYRMAETSGLSDDDFSAVVKILKRRNLTQH